LLKFQLTATIVTPLLLLAVSLPAAMGALAGGVIAVIATGLQASRFFGPYRAQNPKAILANMVRTEVTKLAVTAALFALLFKSFDGVEPLPVFSGFVVVYLTPLVAALKGQPQVSKPH
jgi:F0F1-type ATP synthase assembly protein I